MIDIDELRRKHLQDTISGSMRRDTWPIGDCGSLSAGTLRALLGELEALRAANEHLEGIVKQCKDWCSAYPLTTFPEPDLEAVQKLLLENNMRGQMDKMHGSWARHIISGMAKILEQKD